MHLQYTAFARSMACSSSHKASTLALVVPSASTVALLRLLTGRSPKAPRRELAVEVALALRFGRHNHIEKQVGVTVISPPLMFEPAPWGGRATFVAIRLAMLFCVVRGFLCPGGALGGGQPSSLLAPPLPGERTGKPQPAIAIQPSLPPEALPSISNVLGRDLPDASCKKSVVHEPGLGERLFSAIPVSLSFAKNSPRIQLIYS